MSFRVPTIVCVTLLTLALPSIGGAQSLPDANRLVDAGSSTVGFTVSARMLFTVQRHGRFDNFAGVVSYEPDRPSDTRVNLTVYTASVDTHDPEQDALLRSTDFFDSERFPTMRFVSTSAAKAGDRTLALTGDLTIHGVTKRVVVPVTIVPSRGDAGGAAQFLTDFDIDRTDFGLNGRPSWKGMNVSIAHRVRIHLAIATNGAER
jgi:polyisoprenoid-binding protein YceI